MNATLAPDGQVPCLTELVAPRRSPALANRSKVRLVEQVRVDAAAGGKAIPDPAACPRVTNWRAHFAALRERIRSRGLVRAAPASLALATTSLILTAAVQVPSPAQQAANTLLVYKGEDFYTGQLWRLATSGLLAQSWAQWIWTLFVAIAVFAVLEVQVGPARLLACVAASHILPTVAVALVAPLLGRGDLLGQVDYGTSCLVIGAAAALSWVLRSPLLAAIMAAGLTADLVLSAPLTAIEHLAALTVGVVLVAGTRRARKPRPQSGFVTDA
jgi:membrane associated rhomboid family serine protease